MDASVSFLLDNLRQVVDYHAKLITGAEDELKMLEEELEFMKSKLKDASKRHKKEEAFKKWEKKIRDVVYKVEDTIDECITHMAAKNTVARTFGITGISLAKKVKSLRETSIRDVFDPAKAHFADLSVADSTGEEIDEETVEGWRSKEPKKRVIVGLQDERDTLFKYLTDKSDILEVISIIGMPGLGKTTLAWKIFQDPEIQYEFPVRIWVTVSQTLNRKTLFLNILKEFTQSDEHITKNDEDLASLVKERLDRGKFLIILDDLWTVEAWSQIKEALPIHNGLCKVLLTTRNSNVASRAMTTKRLPHKLRFLNEKESWELLQYGVYDKLDAVDKDLVNVGKVIAKDCDGLPLSIVVIAGILRDKLAATESTRKEWEKISGSVKEHLKEDTQGRISKIIELSYSKLPYDLRDCFLYLGMFPEDALVPAWKLILIWIAEGFILPKPDKSLEDIAQANLNDLIRRSLVMVQETKLGGGVKTISIHDAIHEFCKNEAGVENHNLFQEVRMNEREKSFHPPLQKIQGYRRLAIHSYVRDFFSKKIKVPAARSFVCFPKDPINLKVTDLTPVTDAFTLLRVLHAEKINFPKFPLKLTILIHLRYLTLSFDFELKILPDAISKLWNLQTLIVITKSRTLDIKADIWKMKQLRHVKTKSSVTVMSGKGTGGENLRTLSKLSTECCTDGVLTKAMNLHTLGVHGDLSKLLIQPNCMENLDCLVNLKLEHDSYHSVAAEKPLRGLPEAHKFPKNLMVLTLRGTHLDWGQMLIVGVLVNLEVLKVKDNAFVGNSWSVGDNHFMKLEYLYIERNNLIFWTVSDHTFPRLKSLTLKNCEKFYEVPSVLGKTLEMLALDRVTQNAVNSARNIELAKQEESNNKMIFKLVIGAGDKNSKS